MYSNDFLTALSVLLFGIGLPEKPNNFATTSSLCGIRYNELMKKVQGITNTMLASSLKEMESDGLVTRVQYNEMPIRVEYFITEKSKELMPTLQSLAMWGM